MAFQLSLTSCNQLAS